MIEVPCQIPNPVAWLLLLTLLANQTMYWTGMADFLPGSDYRLDNPSQLAMESYHLHCDSLPCNDHEAA